MQADDVAERDVAAPASRTLGRPRLKYRRGHCELDAGDRITWPTRKPPHTHVTYAGDYVPADIDSAAMLLLVETHIDPERATDADLDAAKKLVAERIAETCAARGIDVAKVEACLSALAAVGLWHVVLISAMHHEIVGRPDGVPIETITRRYAARARLHRVARSSAPRARERRTPAARTRVARTAASPRGDPSPSPDDEPPLAPPRFDLAVTAAAYQRCAAHVRRRYGTYRAGLA